MMSLNLSSAAVVIGDLRVKMDTKEKANICNKQFQTLSHMKQTLTCLGKGLVSSP